MRRASTRNNVVLISCSSRGLEVRMAHCLKYLLAKMTATKSFEESTYPTWLRFFVERDGADLILRLGLSCVLAVLLQAPEWVERWVTSTLSCCNPNRQRVKVVLAPIFLGSLYARLDECFSNITELLEDMT